MNMSDEKIQQIEAKHPAKGALLRAIKAVGGAQKLARQLPGHDGKGRGISHQIIYRWIKEGGCPTARAADIAAVSGVAEHKLRKAA